MNYDLLALTEVQSAWRSAHEPRCVPPTVFVPPAPPFLAVFQTAEGSELRIPKVFAVLRDRAIRTTLTRAPKTDARFWFRDDGHPTPGHFRLIWYAYSPFPVRLCEWLDVMEARWPADVPPSITVA